MSYLLDTHIVIWSLFEPAKIAPTIHDVLIDETAIKFVSGINLWEISLKYSLGKLSLGSFEPDTLLDELLISGYELLEIDGYLLATSFKLPKKADHRDPFDRLLIWQAIANDYTLLTQDRAIEQYQADGLQLLVA